MSAVERIEVILPEALVQPFTDLIETGRYQAYTVQAGLAGRGGAGLETAGLCNAAFTIICTVEEAAALASLIEPFLKTYGGVACIITARGINCGRSSDR